MVQKPRHIVYMYRYFSVQCSLGVVFYSTPQDLDDVKDNSSVIVAGSVIQLFCSASGQFTAPHIQWTRDDITIPETVQLPYLMVKSRTQNNFTSSTLIIGGFSETDNGCYSCLAQETGGSSAISAPLLLTGLTASARCAHACMCAALWGACGDGEWDGEEWNAVFMEEYTSQCVKYLECNVHVRRSSVSCICEPFLYTVAVASEVIKVNSRT